MKSGLRSTKRFAVETNICYGVAAFSIALAIVGLSLDVAIHRQIFPLLWSALLIVGASGAFSVGRLLDRYEDLPCGGQARQERR